MNQDVNLNEIKANSIGNDKKNKLKVKTKNIAKAALTTLLILSFTVGLCACGVSNIEEKQDINYKYVDMYTFETKAFLDKYIINSCSSVEDYENLIHYLNEADMIIYYDKLGISETNKICMALGYENFDDFLIKNNYVDSEGKASVEKLREVSYINITQEMMGKSK